MLQRVSKVTGIGIGIALCYAGPLQASPIGLYFKPLIPIVYWGEETKKENIVISAGGFYQFNRFRIWEINVSLLTTIKPPLNSSVLGSDRKNILYAATFIDKHVIPLKYYFNLYSQWGFSYRNTLGLHAPFFGAGATYYYNRRWSVDFSWRNYSLLKELNDKGYVKTRKNSFILFGIGYYIR